MPKTAIVIGAGIVGLATARALAIRGYKVTVLERHAKAVGASIRNFGMVWPIGQKSGMMYERAMISRTIWKTICYEASIWHEETGSLHLAYNELEQLVLEEFYTNSKQERNCSMLDRSATMNHSEAIVPSQLVGSLFSNDELIVDPREAIAKIPLYLKETYDVQFVWLSGVTKIFHPNVWCGKKTYEADEIFVCNGADYETLFPESFSVQPLTKCKLQMMRMEEQPSNWRMGPSLCGGLSLIHYKSFESAASISRLIKKFNDELPDYIKWGIHVMVAQNGKGELTIGDSHEYGSTFDPFDKVLINKLILDYLKTFARFKNERLIESWNGIYSKLTDGRTELVLIPQNGVTVINGLGGAGMTLSFGLCEQVIAQTYKQNSMVHTF